MIKACQELIEGFDHTTSLSLEVEVVQQFQVNQDIAKC